MTTIENPFQIPISGIDEPDYRLQRNNNEKFLSRSTFEVQVGYPSCGKDDVTKWGKINIPDTFQSSSTFQLSPQTVEPLSHGAVKLSLNQLSVDQVVELFYNTGFESFTQIALENQLDGISLAQLSEDLDNLVFVAPDIPFRELEHLFVNIRSWKKDGITLQTDQSYNRNYNDDEVFLTENVCSLIDLSGLPKSGDPIFPFKDMVDNLMTHRSFSILSSNSLHITSIDSVSSEFDDFLNPNVNSSDESKGFTSNSSFSQSSDDNYSFHPSIPRQTRALYKLNESLLVAIERMDMEVLKICLDAGANANLTSNNGETALMLAVRMGQTAIPIMELLIKHGATIDKTNDNGATALIIAIQNVQPEVVKFLTLNNADMSIKDHMGGNALFYAKQCQHPQILKLLHKPQQLSSQSIQSKLVIYEFLKLGGNFRSISNDDPSANLNLKFNSSNAEVKYDTGLRVPSNGIHHANSKAGKFDNGNGNGNTRGLSGAKFPGGNHLLSEQTTSTTVPISAPMMKAVEHAIDCLHKFISLAPGSSIDGTALASFYEEYPSCKNIVRNIKATGICEVPYARGKLRWVRDESFPGKGRMLALTPPLSNANKKFLAQKFQPSDKISPPPPLQQQYTSASRQQMQVADRQQNENQMRGDNKIAAITISRKERQQRDQTSDNKLTIQKDKSKSKPEKLNKSKLTTNDKQGDIPTTTATASKAASIAEISNEQIEFAIDCLQKFVLARPGRVIDGTILAEFYDEFPACRTTVRLIKVAVLCDNPYAVGKLIWIRDESLPGKGRIFAVSSENKQMDKLDCASLITAGGHYVVLPGQDRNVFIFDTTNINSIRLLHRLDGNEGSFFSLSYRCNDNSNSTNSNSTVQDINIRIWNRFDKLYSSTNAVTTLRGYPISIRSSSVSIDGKRTASASNTVKSSTDKKTFGINIWDIENSKLITQLTGGHVDMVLATTFHPLSNSIVASASADSSIRIWNTDTRISIMELRDHIENMGPVNSICFHPDGKTLVSGSNDGIVRIWDTYHDLRTVVRLRKTDGNTTISPGKIYTVGYNFQGNIIAAGSSDGTIRLWNISSSIYPIFIFDCRSSVFSLNFNFIGNRVICGCQDGNIIIWDCVQYRNNAPLHVLRDLNGPVYAVCYI